MYDASSPSDPAGGPPRRERTISPRAARSFSDDTLEGLIDRSMDATLQAATDVKTLVEMLHLLLQRFRVQMLRLENEIAAARAERSQIQRQVEQQREEAEVAAWELRQALEREGAQARARLGEEMAALRAQAEEEARHIRLEAEREAAALLAAAQARRTELLADLQPWRRELDGVRQRLAREGLELSAAPPSEDVADVAPAAAAAPASAERAAAPIPAAPATPPETPPAPASRAPEPASGAAPAPSGPSGAAPAPANTMPGARPVTTPPSAGAAAAAASARAEPERAAASAQEGGTSAEIVFLRVPDTRRAMALEAAVGALPGVTSCRLREFERGRLVLDVEHEPGTALADRVRGLADFDLRLTTARDGHLEFQVL
ncbi:MAG TPA: hypothetical protein VFE37_20280 [Chloroflexota bacterium]|nr:hypothetical protein [Chloroflexota bacterium]